MHSPFTMEKCWCLSCWVLRSCAVPWTGVLIWCPLGCTHFLHVTYDSHYDWRLCIYISKLGIGHGRWLRFWYKDKEGSGVPASRPCWFRLVSKDAAPNIWTKKSDLTSQFFSSLHCLHYFMYSMTEKTFLSFMTQKFIFRIPKVLKSSQKFRFFCCFFRISHSKQPDSRPFLFKDPKLDQVLRGTQHHDWRRLFCRMGWFSQRMDLDGGFIYFPKQVYL